MPLPGLSEGDKWKDLDIICPAITGTLISVNMEHIVRSLCIRLY